MASTILGLMGKSGAGKDEVAKHLVAEHGYTRLAFADILKETALAINPDIIDEDADLSYLVAVRGWDEAKKIGEVRRFLQALGAAVRDNLDEDAWITPVMRRAADIDGPVVITDVRYENEALAVESGCIDNTYNPPIAWSPALVRVVRPGQHGLEGANAQHASETALDDHYTEFTIMNDRTISQLQIEVDTLMEVL